MCSEAGQKGLYFWFQEHPVKASRDPSPFHETRDGLVRVWWTHWAGKDVLFYRCHKWGPEKLRGCMQVTQEINGPGEHGAFGFLLLSFVHSVLGHHLTTSKPELTKVVLHWPESYTSNTIPFAGVRLGRCAQGLQPTGQVPPQALVELTFLP